MGKPTWFRRSVIDNALVFGLLTGIWIFLVLGGFELSLWARLSWAVGWPLLLGLATMLGSERGVLLDEEGLTVVRWFRPATHYPWSVVRACHAGAYSSAIVTDLGSIFIDTGYRGRRRLLRLVTDRLRGEEDGEQVSHDEISALLGCDADHGLTCTAPVRFLRLWPLGLAGLLAAGGQWVAAAVVAVLSWRWATADQRRHWVRADAHGLEIRRGRHEVRLAWRDVDSIEQISAPYGRFYWSPQEYLRDRLVRVHTDQGVVEWLQSDSRGRDLAEAIERVLAARAAGRRLPEVGLLNNASLSPARATGAESERSISLARD